MLVVDYTSQIIRRGYFEKNTLFPVNLEHWSFEQLSVIVDDEKQMFNKVSLVYLVHLFRFQSCF